MPVALDVEFEDGRVMHQAIDGGERHGRIGKDFIPLAEGLVGGDQDRAMFIACADEFEQDTGFGLIFGDVGEIVEDQQMKFIELLDGGLQCEFTAGELQFLHQIGGAGKQDAPAVLNQGQADGDGGY